LAPARVSSHDLICGGVKVTLPAPRYTQRHVQPWFLPTVTRAGGCSAD
jgi:hypothetical protein